MIRPLKVSGEPRVRTTSEVLLSYCAAFKILPTNWLPRIASPSVGR
jgi:hypothetical protein